MSDATQTSMRDRAAVISVPLQAGTLVTVVLGTVLGKGYFVAQDTATQNVVDGIADLRTELSTIRSELQATKKDVDSVAAVTLDMTTAKLQISTLQGEREKLEARVAILEECVRSKARCRL